jgi:hypothetical protein
MRNDSPPGESCTSVEAACHKHLRERGMIYKLTSSYSGKRVKKEARDDIRMNAASIVTI